AATAKVLTTYRTFSSSRAFAFSPDGERLATPGPLNSIAVWDPRAGKNVDNIQGHKSDISGLAYSPDGRLLASASGDGTVKLWPPSRSRDALLLTTPGMITGMDFSPDGRWLASTSYNGMAAVSAAAPGGEVRQFPAYDNIGGRVAFSPDGK